jgi:primosomal replication protein N
MSEFSMTGTVTTEPELVHTGAGVPFCGFHLVEDDEAAPASNPLEIDVISRGILATSCAQLLAVDSRVRVGGCLGRRQMKRGKFKYPVFAAIAASVDPVDADAVEPPMSRVVHCQKDAYDIYIGRGRCPQTDEPGQWGNPYSHRPSKVPGVIQVKTEHEAIERYERWLWGRIRSGHVTVEMLAALHGKTFGCWCWGACHGSVLARAAAWAYRQAHAAA